MRKGLTAVVAIVLLLMMTVGAAGLAYLRVSTLQNNVQDTAGSNVKQISDESGARIIIDSIWNSTADSDGGVAGDCAGGCIAFNLRNTGSYTFDEGKMMFYVGNTAFDPNNAYDGNSLAPTGIMTVKTNQPYPGFGESKSVKVTTEIGSAQATSQCEILPNGKIYC